MALLAVGKIRNLRRDLNRQADKTGNSTTSRSENNPVKSHAYILHSLKHPDEVKALRKIYGRAFHLISAYCSRDKRIESIAQKICSSRYQSDKAKFRGKAEELIQRDEEELETEYGQDVKDAFPLGDVFIKADSRKNTQNGLSRFVDLLFGHPFHTPKKDEFGMFYARASALRSADLSRQVGAAITTADGDLITIGCNDVPKASGGLYWPGDADFRDFQMGYDASAKVKQEILAEILHRLQKSGWLSKSKSGKDIDELVKDAMRGGNNALMRGARLMNVLEFGRIVHAEMAALMDAARRGIKVNGATLYTTTFPCHMCARHIVASGIRRVVYIEPYPKSMARDLYPDSISVDGEDEENGLVRFEAFVGVSPRRYAEVFDMPKRKDSQGKIIPWKKLTSAPRLERVIPSYLWIETDAVKLLSEILDVRKLKLTIRKSGRRAA